MPLVRRMPKRGFSNARHATAYLPVNVGELNCFEAGARVDHASLRSFGLAQGKPERVKILGGGELEKTLVVCAHAFSASARAKIEARGGRCELVGEALPAANS